MVYQFKLQNNDYEKKIAASFSKEGQIVHKQLIEILNPQKSDCVLDLGCGWGSTFPLLLQKMGKSGQVVGFDVNEHFLAIAERTFHEELSTPQLKLVLGKQGEALPFGDNSFDKIVCHNVLENVINKAEILKECYRILKPGGILLLSHTDFDTAVYNSSYKDLSRRLIHNFADFTQSEWQEVSDGQMGRKLRSIVASSLFKNFSVQTLVLSEIHYTPNNYGFRYSNLIAESAKRSDKFSDNEINEWLEDLKKMDAKNAYYFSILIIGIVAQK